MRCILHLKFIVVYLAFGFIAFFTTVTLSSTLNYSKLESMQVETLNQQATILAIDLLPEYFASDTMTFNTELEHEVNTLLEGMENALDATIWLVSSDGTVLAYGKSSGTVTPPTIIENFNPAESGSSTHISGYYHNYLDEESTTVIAPITSGFYTTGYVLIHKDYNDIEETHREVMSMIYFMIFIVYIFSFSILLAFHLLIYRPLRRITEAAQQYASGNLNHEIAVRSHDEMGYLSASLNYMSSQLQDMEDYQKKFIGNVSHDFRSPLTSIKGYITALSDGTIPPELHEKYFNIILFETERLTDLTKDLLTLNEFDTKELLLNKESFDLHEMVKNVATSFEGTCRSKKISIELLLASKYLSVYCDRRKIQQVLYNLVDNAIKFSDIDSSIVIETSEVNDKVFVSVKDYGSGISKENLNKIWERFFKSDVSRGRDKKGTGLGLAIVKEIITAHNEHINVISTEGVGTEFIFSLPRPKK